LVGKLLPKHVASVRDQNYVNMMRRGAGLTATAAIWLGTAAVSFGQTVANSSFETPALSSDSFVYDPSGATWTFLNNAGIINAPGGGFFGPSAPDGSQYAFLQSATNPGAFSETITFTLSGTYRLSYFVAGRSNNGEGAAGDLSYQALFDSLVIGSDSTTTSQPFTLQSFDFVASSGIHTVTFEAMPDGADNTAFFDLVSIQPVPEPTVNVLLLSSVSGFLFVRVARRRRQYERINTGNALT
jgi:hypothetical protein